MEPIKVHETSYTPEINLDRDRSRFEFYGKSYPEDPNEFYEPIVNWFKLYVVKPNRETNVIFKLDYFNTSSSKKIIDILTILKEVHRQKKQIIIHWYYRTGDDDMYETGETFSEIVNLPFKLTPY